MKKLKLPVDKIIPRRSNVQSVLLLERCNLEISRPGALKLKYNFVLKVNVRNLTTQKYLNIYLENEQMAQGWEYVDSWRERYME